MNINFGLHSQRRKGDFKLMRYQSHIRCNIAYTPWPSAYCPPSLTTIYLGNITSFVVRSVIPLSAYTDTGHLVRFEDCGSILLAADTEDSNWFLITSRLNPTYIASLFIIR